MEKITVEHLIAEANSEHTYFTEFALTYNKIANTLYCFYEGYDDTKYYSIRVKNITLNSDCKSLYCAGKDNTLNAFKLISEHKEYDLNRVLLFVDKDYSEKIESEYIYCTPVYSIENFYTNVEVLEAIITEEFKVNKHDTSNNDFQIIIDLFSYLFKEFHKKTAFFNAWLACQNDIRIAKGETRRLHIDDRIKEYFRKIVSVDLQNISDFSYLNDKSKIDKIFTEAYRVDEKHIDLKLKEFEKTDCNKSFRGKFEMKFFISFLDRLKNELGRRDSMIFSKKYKINLFIEFSSAISALSQYAISPGCLIKYLQKHKNAA